LKQVKSTVKNKLNASPKLQGADEDALGKIFAPPPEKCVGHSLKTIGHGLKNVRPSQKNLCSPCCLKLVTGLIEWQTKH